MAVIEKGILIVAGTVFVGLVGYKILKKKKPSVIEKCKKSVLNIQKKTSEMFEGTKEAFQQGYANA